MFGLHDVGCLRSFLALHNLEVPHTPLLQALVAFRGNRAVVYEHVWPIVSSNEAIAFCVIEPLHSTFHRSTYAPWKSVLTRALCQICCHCASGVKDCQEGEDCTT